MLKYSVHQSIIQPINASINKFRQKFSRESCPQISESPETSDKIINFETGRQNPNVNIYEKYLVEVAQALGADYMVAANDVQDVVDLLIELAQVNIL